MSRSRRRCRAACSWSLALARARAARAVPARRHDVLRRRSSPDDDHGDLRHEPRPAGGRAPGLVSFGHAAFFGLGAATPSRSLTPQDERGRACGRRCRLRVGGRGLAALVDRLLRAPHARHLLHHGDARVRADGVTSCSSTTRSWRRLGRHLRQLQARRAIVGWRRSTWRTSSSLLLLRAGRAACWSTLSCGALLRSPVRPGAARASASTSTACARWASGTFALQARGVHAGRRAGRARGLPAGRRRPASSTRS